VREFGKRARTTAIAVALLIRIKADWRVGS
jgi:hypothetical protein